MAGAEGVEGAACAAIQHYITCSHTHWLLVPGGQDTAASSINPFLSIPKHRSGNTKGPLQD